MSPEWRKVNLICSLDGDRVVLRRQPLPAMRPDQLALFDVSELEKYMTDEELVGLDAPPSEAPAKKAEDRA
jgi:succinate dehydrogenase / fumarate reductase flavoprotein subunit